MNPGLIIDTDIGSDVDDAIALAYAASIKMDIRLITTVHGPTMLRANIAKRMCNELGLDVIVAAGESKPIKQRQIFLTGLEGEATKGERYASGGNEYSIENNAVELIRKTAYENPGVAVAAIGPLTNIAKAFQLYPELPGQIGHIYIMGNAIVTQSAFYLNYRAHNLKADPEAADIVFAADVPKTIVTTDVCKKNYITRDELRSLGGNPALDYIREASLRWLDFIGYDRAYLYDPLVVHHFLNPSITTRASYGKVDVTTDVDGDFRDNVLAELLKKHGQKNY